MLPDFFRVRILIVSVTADQLPGVTASFIATEDSLVERVCLKLRRIRCVRVVQKLLHAEKDLDTPRNASCDVRYSENARLSKMAR